MGQILIPLKFVTAGRRYCLGKKKGHIYIEVKYDIAAEDAGMANRYIGLIKKMVFGNDDFNYKPRKGDQVYSTFTIRIW